MSFLHDCVNVPSPGQVLRDMHGDELEIVDCLPMSDQFPEFDDV